MSELDLSALESEVIKSALNKTIEKRLGTSEFVANIQPATKKGDNFVGIVYRVTVTKTTTKSDQPADLKLILKVAPQHSARRDAFNSRKCFTREMYMYNEVLAEFRQFEESKGVIVGEGGFNEYPACYTVIDEEPYETLILEDLSVDNFIMLDRQKDEITADHVKLVMSSLGKFHALSFALKDQQPEKFKELTSQLDEVFYRLDNENMSKFVSSFGPIVIGHAEKIGDDAITEKIKKLFSVHVLEALAELVDSSIAEPYSVIGHSDCWTNNTLFKLDENHNPVEIRLLDFQISRYGSPVLDLLQYIFSNTQKELRDQHYDDFLKVYHGSLSEHLQRLGSDAEKLFPYSAMLEQLQKLGKFGTYIASMFLPMLTADTDDIPDLDALSEDVANGKEMDGNLFQSESNDARLLKRLGGVFKDMDRLGYI